MWLLLWLWLSPLEDSDGTSEKAAAGDTEVGGGASLVGQPRHEEGGLSFVLIHPTFFFPRALAAGLASFLAKSSLGGPRNIAQGSNHPFPSPDAARISSPGEYLQGMLSAAVSLPSGS